MERDKKRDGRRWRELKGWMGRDGRRGFEASKS